MKYLTVIIFLFCFCFVFADEHKSVRDSKWESTAKQLYKIHFNKEWESLDKEDKQSFIKLSKCIVGDVWRDDFPETLRGIVIEDSFVVTGRYYEVERFYQCVQYLKYSSFNHGEYSHISDFNSFVEFQLKRNRGNKEISVKWDIKNDIFRENVLQAINEAIEVWPGKIEVIESNGIKGK